MFINYTAAFIRIGHEELFKMLANLDIDGKDILLLRNLSLKQAE